MDASSLREHFANKGQGHVFQFWDQLDVAAREQLAADAAEIDLDEIARLTDTLIRGRSSGTGDFSGLEPAPYTSLPANGGDASAWESARAAGEEALSAGRVAAFVVAGGQGTRLGYDGPKGTFPVTPVTKKPLFQVFAEKILAAGRRYGKPLHWFIMTSHANHAQTEAFFADNKFFGLDAARVHFFKQGRMPAVDFEGKILLEAKDLIAMSPDGHGGSLRALDRSGALSLMRSEGVDTLSYFQVDNPLVRCVDPEFIGFHLTSGSEMSSKMVPKVAPAEKVGHFCTRGGRIEVVEYSDLPVAMQEQVDPITSRLRFIAGSIAIHAIDREFASRLGAGAGELPFHRADKKIVCVDAAGNTVNPAKANGVKFEMFVFDALPFAKNPIVLETARADDFSPVKNATGVDSADTCRADQLRQFARWLRSCGANVPVDSSGLPPFVIEVSPLFGHDLRTFKESWSQQNPKPAIEPGLVLG
ncbi:MAG TPA: UDPGP type 1 family protein [Opitutaceae bacterium]|nr:UDPGP type 1 family protein [Opitutaceae bacterium]